MKRRKIFGCIVRPLCFVLLCCLLMGAASQVLMDKNGADIIAPFYEEEKDSLDVLFFGSSHIMCGIYPLSLWDEYGIASYDCSTSAQVLPQTYFQIQDALHYQTPSLVVLDVSGVYFGDILVGSESYVHTQLDNMKTLSVRLRAIHRPSENVLPRWAWYISAHFSSEVTFPLSKRLCVSRRSSLASGPLASWMRPAVCGGDSPAHCPAAPDCRRQRRPE